MRRRLSRYSDSQEVEETISHLQRLQLLNDVDFSTKFASYNLKEKNQGVRRIEHELRARLVPESVVQIALQNILEEHTEEEAALEAVESYLRRKEVPSSPRDYRRFLTHLYRLGFSSDTIQAALRRKQIHFDFSTTDPEL